MELSHIYLAVCTKSTQRMDLWVTGISVSDALFVESVNPQYDKRLFIEFPENTSSDHDVFKYCLECQNRNKTVFVHNIFCVPIMCLIDDLTRVATHHLVDLDLFTF